MHTEEECMKIEAEAYALRRALKTEENNNTYLREEVLKWQKALDAANIEIQRLEGLLAG